MACVHILNWTAKTVYMWRYTVNERKKEFYGTPTYQRSSFLLDNQANVLPILPENRQILLFVLTCDRWT